MRLPRDPLQWLRGVAISISAVGMFLAVWIMPLAEATTIVFTQPIITAVLAMVVLGERARPSTWLATLVAFGGVFLVLRPNFETAGWGVLLPVMSAAGMAVTIIANRKVTGRASVLAMQYYMSVTAMLFLLVATSAAHFSGLENFRVGWPHWSVVARCVFIGFTATLAQWLIFMGTVKAGAGTVAPMTYGQLLMAVALGLLFFGEGPDLTALAGAAVIVAAGLFLWWRGRGPRPCRRAGRSSNLTYVILAFSIVRNPISRPLFTKREQPEEAWPTSISSTGWKGLVPSFSPCAKSCATVR